MASIATPRQVFEALINGVAAGRFDALPALYAEHTDVTHPFDPMRQPALRTRSELAEHFALGASAAASLSRRPMNVLIHETTDPEVVIGEFEYLCSSEETGEFRIPCVFVLRVRGGEIVESRDYIDPLARPRADGRVGELLEEVRLRDAREAYVRGVFFGERERVAGALAGLVALDGPAAKLECGKLLHVDALRERQVQPGEREAFAAALAGFRDGGDRAAEAEALFWLGVCAQFDGDDDEAEPLLRSSYELAVETGEPLTQSYAARHLGFVAAARGNDDEARSLLRESLRLREELEFEPGVAAAKLALAEFERECGHGDEADALLEDAERLARAIGAAGVLTWIDEVRGAT
jgi:uncharacterized protein